MRMFSRWCAVAILLFACDVAEAQSVPRVSVTPFAEAGITLEDYSPEKSPLLASFIENNPDLTLLRPLAALVTNSSAKKVVGLTLRWSWRDSEGQTHIRDYKTDSLFLVNTPVAQPNSRILVTPGYLWAESYVEFGSMTGGMQNLRRDVGIFDRSSEVVVHLDTVIFDDGLVIGPDVSRTLADIRARKAVSDSISLAVVQMVDGGGDPTNLLREYANTRGENDLVNRWYVRLSGLILRAPDRRAQAEQLLNTPQVSHLRRNP